MSYKENALPLEEGKVNLGSGVVDGGGVYVCVADGDLEVTWISDTTDTINCVAGHAFDIRQAKSVEVLSGTFHRA